MIRLNGPVLAKCKTDKSEHHQDGTGYHMQITEGERAVGRIPFQFGAISKNPAA
jgi:hypothetical protein